MLYVPKNERRRMAEEERWMKLYIRSVALEQERENFESRRMELEDRLGMRIRQEEQARIRAVKARVLAEVETAERRKMAKEDELSAKMQGTWQKDDMERQEAKAQRDLAKSLIAVQPPPRRQSNLAEDATRQRHSYAHRRWKEWVSILQSHSSQRKLLPSVLSSMQKDPVFAKSTRRPRSKQGENVLSESHLLVCMYLVFFQLPTQAYDSPDFLS